MTRFTGKASEAVVATDSGRVLQRTVLVHSDALEFLARVPDGVAELVYLDPPWSRGFATADSLVTSDHSRFRAFAAEYVGNAILQSRTILRDDGFLFLHLDAVNAGAMRVILDQVFGADNFRAEIVWPQKQKRTTGRRQLPNSQRIILCYAKSSGGALRDVFRPFTEDEIQMRAKGEDERGSFKLAELTYPGRERLGFTFRGVAPPEGRTWKFSEERLNQLDDENRIYWGTSGRPSLKVYLADLEGMPVGDLWDDIPMDPRVSREERPLELSRRIISIATSENDLVVDPFSGSGTTIVAASGLGRSVWAADASEQMIELATLRCAESHIKLDNTLNTGESRVRPVEDRWVQQLARASLGHLNFEVAQSRYQLGQVVAEEETIVTEFKEVKGGNPLDAIEKRADEYAVAFLNAAVSGKIVWGVRDEDRVVVGVALSANQRDHLRRLVTEKLSSIAPAIPVSAFTLEIIRLDGEASKDPALCVVELKVAAPPLRVNLYFTQSGDAYIKTEGGRRKLNGPQIQEETMHRMELLKNAE